MKIITEEFDDTPQQEMNPDYTLIDDMILSPEQYDVLFNNVSRRSGLTQTVQMWPKGVVPYYFDMAFSKSSIFSFTDQSC